eukprot:CAMPEP_0206145640 /NCGR_PEP_ID=MMETSP1473-20131121/28049_1 /ASSEMBLY_ACC=CAM_ASM_001109 /TAXON_ID=1461547 /ORGANISM="Stichococcus sp, Strain RCC1054" /LENGTH=101 /DNA_ID=CAMNT_0053541919 /DNA_START=320 /DNA_END=626 /DNA_ORIENTATION=+
MSLKLGSELLDSSGVAAVLDQHSSEREQRRAVKAAAPGGHPPTALWSSAADTTVACLDCPGWGVAAASGDAVVAAGPGDATEVSADAALFFLLRFSGVVAG